MKSVSLLRSLQIVFVLIQIAGLVLLSDLCTGFQSAKSCQADETVYGIERYCLPIGIRDIKTLFKSDVPWTAAHYVLLYTGIWILLALIDLVFAILFWAEKNRMFRKDAGSSSSVVMCLLELTVLCAQVFGALYVYSSWSKLWAGEYYEPRFPLQFHIGFFIAAICLLTVIFEEFVVSPHIYFVQREKMQDNEIIEN